jgi:hypothetical protein
VLAVCHQRADAVTTGRRESFVLLFSLPPIFPQSMLFMHVDTCHEFVESRGEQRVCCP